MCIAFLRIQIEDKCGGGGQHLGGTMPSTNRTGRGSGAARRDSSARRS